VGACTTFALFQNKQWDYNVKIYSAKIIGKMEQHILRTFAHIRAR
jgi:hypothetical protein